MTLKIDKRCKACLLCRNDKKFMKRLYESKAYIEGGEPLTVIARDPMYEGQFTYQGLWNHCDKHMGIDADTMASRKAQRDAKTIEAQQMREVISHNEVRQELVDTGIQQLRDGTIKMSSSTLAALLKQQSEIEEKNKDRQLEVLKMVQQFQSGEVQFLEEEHAWRDIS